MRFECYNFFYALMNKDGFTLKNPAIITTRCFSDGEFFAPGNILLGMDQSRNYFFSFNIQPIPGGSICSLFIWKFDRYKVNVTNPYKEILLFTSTGKITAKPNNFEVSLIEISNHRLKYFVIGRSISSDDTFLYLSLIMENDEVYNYHITTNEFPLFLKT